ncbi:MAG: sigma-70 family RNA polymerase sigma factor [Chitinophagaceae bacterium]|nr:sigma-70 family RNA polymerase sigma factor [Chitinophagaceae bacterium]MCB0741095.1 sigma-70 family RNA polymerase sigma factor [Chitinophagaceae bacterium]
MNAEILDDLKGENNNAFGRLYRQYFGVVKRFILKNNGRPEDAEDIFQDTMLVLVEKLKRDDFTLTASVKTYIMAIAKNLWFKRLRNTYREVEFTEKQSPVFYREIDQAIENEKNYWDKLKTYLTKITKHCQQLIRKMFFNNESIEQIQKEYGYTTKHNAQNQKHKCIEQIRKEKEKEEKGNQ